MIDFEGPLFVVGMNGSGTTMLMNSLGNHSRLYAFPRETRLIPYFIRNLPGYGDLTDDRNFLRLLQDFGDVSVFRSTNHGKRLPIPVDWQSKERTLASVVDMVYSFFANKEGKAIWCEKTPMHALHLSDLANLFPRAKFVHVIRDGRDCAVSLHRRWSYNPSRSIYRWKNVVAEGRRQGEPLSDRYIEIRYEDVTIDPEASMRAIIDFIGLEFESSVLASTQPYLNSDTPFRKPEPSGANGGIIPNSGKWKAYFSGDEVAKLDQIGGDLLSTLGYDVSEARGNCDPSKLRMHLWLIRDYFFRGYQEISNNFRAGDERQSWKIVFGRIVNSLKQRITSRY